MRKGEISGDGEISAEFPGTAEFPGISGDSILQLEYGSHSLIPGHQVSWPDLGFPRK